MRLSTPSAVSVGWDRRPVAKLALVAALSTVACTGLVGGGGSGDQNGDNGSSTGTGTGTGPGGTKTGPGGTMTGPGGTMTGPGGTVTGPGGTPIDPNAAGPMPLRRLSRREYNNTVRDLLGDMTKPADQ